MRAKENETMVASEQRARAFLASWILGRKTPMEVERERWEPEFLSSLSAEFDKVRDECLRELADAIGVGRYVYGNEVRAYAVKLEHGAVKPAL
jgi:hypothetical protein